MMLLRDGGGIDEIGAIVVRDGSGLSNIGTGLIRDGDSLETFFAPGSGLTLDVTPVAYGAAATNFATTVTTSTVTVTVTGGTAPYTFAWERTDDVLGDWSIASPTAQSTAFRKGLVSPGDNETAYFACTVTDANGNSATTIDVSAGVANYGGLGGPLP